VAALLALNSMAAIVAAVSSGVAASRGAGKRSSWGWWRRCNAQLAATAAAAATTATPAARTRTPGCCHQQRLPLTFCKGMYT